MAKKIAVLNLEFVIESNPETEEYKPLTISKPNDL